MQGMDAVRASNSLHHRLSVCIAFCFIDSSMKHRLHMLPAVHPYELFCYNVFIKNRLDGSILF